LKRPDNYLVKPLRYVAPLAGAWIETGSSWFPDARRLIVAPLAGAWIETDAGSLVLVYSSVAPLAGAWIET